MLYCTTEGVGIQVRQVLRWIMAAEQDADPAVQFLHASYAVGNLDILRQIATDQEIVSATGETPLALLQRASRLQDQAARVLRQRGPTRGDA